ncbi:MAG: TonB-dependent receptor [Pseudomonadota bacterium]|nr:TonB-dependent receptor [Pseudomonadota bacterium]
MRTKPLAYAIAALAATGTNAVRSATEQPQALEPVVVSASRVTESLASIPYTTQIIPGQDIAEQAQPGRNLGQILGQMIPGLAPGDDSATSFYQTLRGRQVLVLIDGVAQRSSRNISRQLTTIAPAMIERVEVISGATAVYGAGATGGVINIITKRGADQATRFNTELGLTLNTENTDADGFTRFGSQTVSGLVGDVDYLVNVSYEQRGDFYDSEGEQIATDPNQVSRDNSDTLDILANIGWQLDATRSFRLSLEHFRERQNTDDAADFGAPSPAYLGLPEGIFAAGGDYRPRPQPGLDLNQQPESTRDSITLDFSDQDFFDHTLLAQLSYRENEYFFYPYPSQPLFLDISWAGVAGALQGGAPLQTAVTTNINGATGTLFQSQVNTEVVDFKLALDKHLALDDQRSLDLTYGLDYIHDNSEQRSIEYDYTQWVASGQVDYRPTGDIYDAGPATTTQTSALFLQGKLALDEHWTLKAGVRYEHADVEADDTVSGVDVANAEFYQQELQDPTLAAIATQLAMTPEMFLATVTNQLATGFGYQSFLTYSDTAARREGGEESYAETLFNAGVVYAFNPNQEAFLNYSEGFDVPDLTRLLRSVTVLSDGGNQGPILQGTNVDATKTHSWDLGWRGRFDRFSAQASLFYNTSDQNVEFDRETGVVVIRDQDERFWGFEALLDAEFDNGVRAGFTYARTQGETEDADGDWYALGADRVAPEKITAYLGRDFGASASARLQVTHLSDYKDGNQEAPAALQSQVVPFEGYRTFDLITHFDTDAGTISATVRNLTNTDYYSVYNQVRGYPQGGASAYLPAQGRTFTLSYSVDY